MYTSVVFFKEKGKLKRQSTGRGTLATFLFLVVVDIEVEEASSFSFFLEFSRFL
jgi:hypothetical protein